MPWVFGYGSLMNRKSAETTCAVGEMKLCTLTGYQRSWNVFYDNPPSTYLGVTEQRGAECIGVLLEVDEKGLRALDVRERGYDRVLISAGGVNAWVYVPKLIRQQEILGAQTSKRYLDIVHSACVEWNIWEQFVQETNGWKFCAKALEELTENLSQLTKDRALVQNE